MSVQGKNSYIYWGRNATFKSGAPATDKHQPFNPLIEFSNPLVQYTQEHVTTPDKLIPNIVFDKALEEGSTRIRTYYRDPFLLLAMFTYKTLPTAWTGTGDTITGTFASLTNQDKDIWVQVHGHEASGSGNDIDMLFDGGAITNYRWSGDAGYALMEEVEMAFADLADASETAVDIDDGFDDGSFNSDTLDGGWSNWDGAYSASLGQVALVKDCTLTWANNPIAGLGVQHFEVDISAPRKTESEYSSLIPAISYLGKQPVYKGVVDGYFTSNSAFAEFLKAYSAKTLGTFKIQYGTTKYLQFTNAYLASIDPPGGIPVAGEILKASMTFLSGANSVASFSWTATETTDPGLHINHTNV